MNSDESFLATLRSTVVSLCNKNVCFFLLLSAFRLKLIIKRFKSLSPTKHQLTTNTSVAFSF